MEGWRFSTTLPCSFEPRSRLFGSHPTRRQAGTTSVRGCYRSRRLLLPYASRRNAPTRAGLYGPSWLRCTNWASISTQYLPPFVGTNLLQARPEWPRSASALPREDHLQRTGRHPFLTKRVRLQPRYGKKCRLPETSLADLVLSRRHPGQTPRRRQALQLASRYRPP